MFRKDPDLNPLGPRKRRLIEESEQHRAQLIADVAVLKAEVRSLTGRARNLGLLASSATLLLGGLTAFQRAPRSDVKAGGSWLRALPQIAGLAFDVWLALRRPANVPKRN